MILTLIIEIVSTNYTILSGLHWQSIWYANLLQNHTFLYKKRVWTSQKRVFELFYI